MNTKKATLCINYDCLRQAATVSATAEVNVVALSRLSLSLTNCEVGN